jgi:ABC-type lipopolysaccharide export system ATPase subunit
MAEQNFHQAVKIADRGYIIVHGRIAFEGRSRQELSENALVKQYYLGAEYSHRALPLTRYMVPDTPQTPHRC